MFKVPTQLRKVLLISTAGLLFLLKFISDIIIGNVGIEQDWLVLARQALGISAFVALFLLIRLLWRRDQGPVRKLGFALVLSLLVGTAAGSLALLPSDGFDVKNYMLIPHGFEAIVLSNIYGVVFGTTMIVTLLILRDIILSRRRKGTRRNFLIILGLILATTVSTIPYRPLEQNILSSILFGITIVAILLLSFRLSWIVFLTKREKLISMAYGFVLSGIFAAFYVFSVSDSSIIAQGIAFYSRQLLSFVTCVEMFGIIYFGMTFISTLFHLPTAEAFDRKASEVSSLHNLSRLITQVMDFNELVDSVTRMTMEVCEAKSAWLEILAPPSPAGIVGSTAGRSRLENGFQTVAQKNISVEETESIVNASEKSLRHLVLESRKPLVVDRVRSDSRTTHLAGSKNTIRSMVIVPLLSHDSVIGVLYATKDMDYGFDKDDVDSISAFADQATIAIENSRLIEKSLERERLMREMMLAQEMQRKLLPQSLPQLKELEVEALSTPALEVGGDYYDFALLDDRHLAVLVGDVSGKGVTAAFYMAEMKGIFQSLSRIHRSPREFLARAHDALLGTIDKRSFISLIYAILDLETGRMTIARAGHCPMLFLSGGRARYVKPTGLGLGMGSSELFSRTIMEEVVQFTPGDVAIMYTDGVTEARAKGGAEFGYDLLLSVAEQAGSVSALGMRDALILAVDKHMDHEPPEDDLTIVVLKWLQSNK